MNYKKITGYLAVAVLAVVLLAIAATSSRPEVQVHTNSQGEVHRLTVYKSPTCGCCSNWVAYMRGKGYAIDVVDSDDMENVKKKYGVPESLNSCHTAIVNEDYFIEGHIPEESIAKLLEETPDILGIGMPGMPSGSPGMPGAKEASFEIMQYTSNNELTVFEEI